MRRCPVCNTAYADDAQNFCLRDGTLLVEERSDYDPQATLQMQGQSNTAPTPTPARTTGASTEADEPVLQRQPGWQAAPVQVPLRASKNNWLLWVLGVALLLSLAGLVVTLLAWNNSRETQTVGRSETSNAESNTNASNSVPGATANTRNSAEAATTNSNDGASTGSTQSDASNSNSAAEMDDVPPPPRIAPTPTPAPKGPISAGVLNGKAVSLPKPTYPPVAKAARQEGTVTVQVVVDESGNVIEARAVSGPPLLQQSAVQAARQAKFSPTKLSGQPVKVTGVITYNFKLQ